MSRLQDELIGSSDKVAKILLGAHIIREYEGAKMVGRVVETEAYDQMDAASHSSKGRTPRTDVIFGPAGKAYVYFTYGMHYCFNVVVGSLGHGSAVLIRAIEPLEGMDAMKQNRKVHEDKQLTNGPAKLSQALKIDKTLNGHDLSQSPLKLELKPHLSSQNIIATTRIGITKDTHRLWRFYETNNAWVSKV